MLSIYLVQIIHFQLNESHFGFDEIYCIIYHLVKLLHA